MSIYIINGLKQDREALIQLIDRQRAAYSEALVERDEKIAEQHAHIVRLNNERDPLTLKIERLEGQLKRARRKSP